MNDNLTQRDNQSKKEYTPAGYAAAGVDITAGYEAVRLIQKHIKRTAVAGTEGDVGGFGGTFALGAGYRDPVLVSGTDGVGTKLKIAFMLDRHDTIGIDCVAMCVNDVICSGAKPLFFLDYIALGKNVPQRVEKIVSGVADGCCMAGAALIGGETAEMPGFYPEDEYDVAGFAVGIAERESLLDASTINEGDALIALASSGVHSNGFSLVRKVFDIQNKGLDRFTNELGVTLGECLLTPTAIYVKPVLRLLQEVRVKSLAHITGGGFYENIPRSLPKGMTAFIDRDKVRVPKIFELISREGDIVQRDMFNTFNMGVGMTAAVDANDAEKTIKTLEECGVEAYRIGTIGRGEQGVVI